MADGKVMEIVNSKDLEQLKFDYLRIRALLYLAIEKLGGEMAFPREAYVALRDSGVPAGLDMDLAYFKDLPRIEFNMGDPVWVAALKPGE